MVALQMQSHDVLLASLREVLTEPELVSDISEACLLNGITVEKLVSGATSVADIQEQLFLTAEEASGLLSFCRGYFMNRHLAADPLGSSKIDCLASVQVVVGQQLEHKSSKSPKSSSNSTAFSRKAPVISIDVAEIQQIPEDDIPVLEQCEMPEIPFEPEPIVTPSRRMSSKSLKMVQSIDGALSTLTERKSKKTAESPTSLRTSNSFKALQKSTAAAALRSSTMSLRSSVNLGNIKSRLLSPTATSLAHMVRKSVDEEKLKLREAYSGGLTASTQHLQEVLNRPQGHRVTEARPFSLQADTRLRDGEALPSDVLAIQRASIDAKKYGYRPAPKFEAPSPRTPSTPKKPQEIFCPFKLELEERGAKKSEEKKKMDAVRQSQEKPAAFKALHWSREGSLQVDRPAKPAAQLPTRPVEVTFKSEARVAHWRSVVVPAKEQREREAQAKLAEEERKRAESEAAAVAEFRKSAVFKARSKPSFDSPFVYDPSKSAPPTKSTEFTFATNSRHGKAQSLSRSNVGIDREFGAMTRNFSSTLRSSVTSLPRSGSSRLLTSQSMCLLTTRSVCLS